jgi:hypothetical protein
MGLTLGNWRGYLALLESHLTRVVEDNSSRGGLVSYAPEHNIYQAYQTACGMMDEIPDASAEYLGPALRSLEAIDGFLTRAPSRPDAESPPLVVNELTIERALDRVNGKGLNRQHHKGDRPGTTVRRHTTGEIGFKIIQQIKALTSAGQWDKTPADIHRMVQPMPKSTFYRALSTNSEVQLHMEHYRRARSSCDHLPHL